VFAFGAARTNELAHQQLLPQMFGPMAVVAGWRFLREPQLRELIILVAGTTWQLFASIYVGWFFVLGLMLFLGVGIAVDVSAVRRFGTFFRIRWLSTGLILIAGAASLIWLFEPYVRVNRDFHRHFADCILPELHSWLAPPPDGIWSDTLASQRKGQDHVQWLFPGFTALGIFGLALLLLLTRARWLTFNDRALIATAVATVLLLVAITTRWPGGATAWRMAFRYLPGANGLRAVTRMFTSVYLFGLLGGTVALDRLLGRMNFSWRMPLSLVLLAAATAEQLHWNLPSFEKAPWLARVDAVRAGLAGHQAGYLRFDPALPYWENHLIAMWAGLKAVVPVVNGFSGRWPPGYPDWSRSWNDDELKQWMAASGSDHVAVLNPDGSVRSILER
jgi:hypothetical protein